MSAGGGSLGRRGGRWMGKKKVQGGFLPIHLRLLVSNWLSHNQAPQLGIWFNTCCAAAPSKESPPLYLPSLHGQQTGTVGKD